MRCRGKIGSHETNIYPHGHRPLELAATKASKFVFEGDSEEVVEFKQDAADEPSEDEDGQGAVEADEDAPEDDFNAAWEVLDLARALYERQGDSDETKLKVADTYIALGDVSLETGAPLFCFSKNTCHIHLTTVRSVHPREV